MRQEDQKKKKAMIKTSVDEEMMMKPWRLKGWNGVRTPGVIFFGTKH